MLTPQKPSVEKLSALRPYAVDFADGYYAVWQAKSAVEAVALAEIRRPEVTVLSVSPVK